MKSSQIRLIFAFCHMPSFSTPDVCEREQEHQAFKYRIVKLYKILW